MSRLKNIYCMDADFTWPATRIYPTASTLSSKVERCWKEKDTVQMLSHHHLQTKHFLSHRRCRHKTQVKENTIDLNWERWRFAAEHLVMRGYHFLSHTRQDWRKSKHSIKKQATKEGTVVVGSLNRWEFPWQYEAISTFKTYSWFPRHNATTILFLTFLLVSNRKK